MRSLKVLVLMHTDLVPKVMPSSVSIPEIQGLGNLEESQRLETPWTTEYDVLYNLAEMGHQVKPLGIYSDLTKIRKTIEEFKPHIVYNLLEEFDGESVFDSHVVSHLELLRTAYTGCNPRGLMIARDKSLAKKILTYHRIKTPKFQVFPKNKMSIRPKLAKGFTYPLIVKCLDEDASLGLSKASVVHNEEKLFERIGYIHRKIEVDAIVEEFITGREFYIGVFGNYRLELLPVWEVFYEKSDRPDQEFYSRSAKWNEKYRIRKGIQSGKAILTDELEKKVQNIAKKTYRTLGLNGYARIDVRMDEDENVFVIEANPNPNIAFDDEFAESALYSGKKKRTYHEVLQRVLNLGLSWRKGGS